VAVLGHAQHLRVRPGAAVDGSGWVEATLRISSAEGAAYLVLSFGPHIEIVEPSDLRRRVGELALLTAKIYFPAGASPLPT
jgi:predicted DNA-binding transcriptional regulator YafY